MQISHTHYSRLAIQRMIDLRFHYAVVSTALILLGFFWNSLKGFDLPYISLIVGTFFANVFMFVINDFYDAHHDSKDLTKKARNPFCSPETIQTGKIVLYASLGLSLFFSGIVSPPIFLVIVLFDLLAFLYSAPPIRLRNRSYWDWIFVFLWKGLVILAGYLYFFGVHFSVTSFMWGTLVIILSVSLIGQMDNQIRDFEVDKTNRSNHSVQRLGHGTSSVLKKIFLAFFFVFSVIFCYFLNLYVTMVLIFLNISLYFFVNPGKYSVVLEYSTIWIVVLFLEHFLAVFSSEQKLLFLVWVAAMAGIAVAHAKRTHLFERTGSFPWLYLKMNRSRDE